MRIGNRRPTADRRWQLCLALCAAASTAARADFSVSYDPASAKISIIDNATGAEVITRDSTLRSSVITRNQGGTDTTIEPTVQWSAHGDPSHADGLDLTFIFDNSQGAAPARPGPVTIPGMVFGLPGPLLGRVRTRDFHIDGKAYDITTDPPDTGWNTAHECQYPGEVFSPVAFLHAGEYALGVSVLYPVVDPDCGLFGDCNSQYAHRVALGVRLPNPDGGRRAWEVRIPLCTHDFGFGNSPSTDGFVPARQVRRYTVCVRVIRTTPLVVPASPSDPLPENLPGAASGVQDWLALFEPYRDYFQQRYLGVLYSPDPRPVQGCSTALTTAVSPSNPYGFGDLAPGGGRPFPDGWARWRLYLGSMRAAGWDRIMIWTPTGVFSPVPEDHNYPFQFTSQWAQQVVPGGEPTLLRGITGSDGGALGLWWGNSVNVMTSWPPTSANSPAPLDPENQQHRDLAYHEVNGAVNIADAAIIGLDAFTGMPPWRAHRWLRQLQTWYPGVRFVQESGPCDIMSTLSPGYMTATRSNADAFYRILTPHYLAELLLPGHELWAQIDPIALADELGHSPSRADFLDKAAQVAALGYVPLVFNDVSVTGLDLTARPAQGVLTCAQRAPRVVRQSAPAIRVTSGQSAALMALAANPGTCNLRWERALDWNVWVALSDDGHFSGTRTPVLTLSTARQPDCSHYRLRLSRPGACADTLSDDITLIVCGSPDFNHDGDAATDADIEAFFACLAGHCCPECDGPDFNADGDAATDADIEAFFRALAGGPC